MRHFFSGSGWPVRRRPYAPPPRTGAEQTALVDLLQEVKNQHYVTMLKRGVPLRPGVLRLMDEALSAPLVKVSGPEVNNFAFGVDFVADPCASPSS
jgi:hypothetical protein